MITHFFLNSKSCLIEMFLTVSLGMIFKKITESNDRNFAQGPIKGHSPNACSSFSVRYFTFNLHHPSRRAFLLFWTQPWWKNLNYCKQCLASETIAGEQEQKNATIKQQFTKSPNWKKPTSTLQQFHLCDKSKRFLVCRGRMPASFFVVYLILGSFTGLFFFCFVCALLFKGISAKQ